MTAKEFLADHEHVIRWSTTDKVPTGLGLELVFIGPSEHGLEVALARSRSRPRVEDVRKLWKYRHGGRPSPVLVVVAHPDHGTERAMICGPVGENPPVVGGLELAQVERLCAAALAEPTRHVAVRFLVAMLEGLHAELIPGIRNMGMLATHELRVGVPQRPDWDESSQLSKKLLPLRGRQLVEALGFGVETLSTNSSVLTIEGAKRVVAVFLDEGEGFEDPATRFSGGSPVSHALALADRENLPWVVLTRGHQIRLYSARVGTGVGHRGPEQTFVELNLALLPEEAAGYLALLFAPDALTDGGTLEQILEASADHAAELGERLRERVYFRAVPTLAKAVAARMGDPSNLGEEELQAAYEQTLVILFRLLFVAYAEDKDLLPYRTNGRYQRYALKTLARDLADQRRSGASDIEFDPNATNLWEQVRSLWRAVDKGNRDWGVPAYNGGLFSNEPNINEAGVALAGISLTNADIGPALFALLVNEGEDEVYGPVDFRSLSVREFGTIYEGLLESRLSVAPSDLTVDARGNYVPTTRKADDVEITQGEVYFHNRSGARKSSGSYFTKPFAVEHLLDHALEPALDDHIARLKELYEKGDEAAVTDAFFDFRCVDLAMGSGHFLVAAIDRIEARLSAFLALHPVAPVTAELQRLRSAALKALGDLADGVEIEPASLLRRQAARRCVYGVDLNSIAVELARLALWIHTFVPGLPLSFLDHNLVEGNSLTGIATLDEALEVLDPARDASKGGSLIGDRIREFLGRAEAALRRMARITEATAAEVEAARDAWDEAAAAVEPARQLFDLTVTARLGEIDLPVEISEEAVSAHADLERAEALCDELQALHFPVVFPEVFLRVRPGFDCILGNPPWEEIKHEERDFWSLRYPGLKGIGQGQQQREIGRLRRSRPDLVVEYEREAEGVAALRRVLVSAGLGMQSGDPDLYKAFCWRFWHLIRENGAIGVVLPRSALSASGSSRWREAILDGGAFIDVTMLLNTAGWVFDDAEHRYTMALVSVRKGQEFAGSICLTGPFANYAGYLGAIRRLSKAEFSADDLRSWSSGASFPTLPSARSLEVFLKLRRHPRLDAEGHGWRARPVAEFHATADKKHLQFDPDETVGLWPVYKGASFNIWHPDTSTYYAWADPGHVTNLLQDKRVRQQRLAKSAFSEFDGDYVADSDTLPCWYPRIAYRQVARATDTRTAIVTLVPGEIVLTNAAPYLLWPEGDERDEAYLLGVLCSIPLDWYARRVVEVNLNFHIFNGFPIPRPARDDPLRRRVENIAGRLAAVDERYDAWAEPVGVPVASVVDEEERLDLIAQLDAAVARLYGLGESDLRHVFETFHAGWDYSARLERVVKHFGDLGSLAVTP
ncbi:MAG: hypothetical protein GEU73_14835, partial [Chloroflexi bacterium]|nr:hypothetical protein [Chloroflexota bacterium]